MNKVAIVTGAAKGIGREVAKRFARDNMKLVLADIDEKELDNTLELVKPITEAVKSVTDVTDEDQVKKCIQTAFDTYGKLDVMAHLAAIMQFPMTVSDTDVEAFDNILRVNMRGTLLILKHSIKVMQPQGRGVIICCGSTSSLMGCPFLSSYVSSKHGVLGLFKCAAGECGSNGIRVSIVVPGCTNTDMMAGIKDNEEYTERVCGPMGRMAEPEEHAACFSFLASDEATYTNGSIMYTNGGLNLCS